MATGPSWVILRVRAWITGASHDCIYPKVFDTESLEEKVFGCFRYFVSHGYLDA